MSKYRLKLYLTGRTPRSQQAIDNLRGLLEEQFAEQYELEVIDVLENPQLAEDDKILATPTVIRGLPAPVRRVVGDLSNRDQVLLGLDLTPISGHHNGGTDHD
jgi:circadian clock protein KaiB